MRIKIYLTLYVLNMSLSILKYKGFEIYCKQGSIDKYREGKIGIKRFRDYR